MATSRTPIKLPNGVWTDLYAVTGISVGTQLVIQNLDGGNVRLSESNVLPISSTGYNEITPKLFLQSASTPIGVWAMAPASSIIQVEEA